MVSVEQKTPGSHQFKVIVDEQLKCSTCLGILLCRTDNTGWWFVTLTPELFLCPKANKDAHLANGRLSFSQSLSRPYVSRGLWGITDHGADCWPLRRGNDETAGQPSRCQTDVQVTWGGSGGIWQESGR